MDRTGSEKSELQRFCSKNVSLRRYGSFNGLSVLHHLELLTSAEKLNYAPFTLTVTESSCTCITSPSEASALISLNS